LKFLSTKRFYQFFVKQSWKEHLQEHFWHLEDRYNRFIESGKSKIVLCSDLRCALSFDSIQDLQYYCQNIYCVERIKFDPIKRCRLTRQSSLNVKAFLSANLKLENYCNLLNGKSFYKYVNKTMDSPMLKTLDLIVSTGSVRIEDKDNLSQSYSLSSIDSIANQKKQSLSVVSFTDSESPLSSID